MSTSGFIAELRRRHVFRVAAAYAFVAWLVIQIAAATFPALQLPEWTTRLIVMICVLGFPVAIALAWAYDVTPQGVVRTDPVAGTGDATGKLAGASPWFALVAGVLLGFAAFQAWRGFAPDAAVTAGADHKSIAVLPFENVSSDAENEHFADGLHDELLTKLAKIHDLKVISRTSVMEYKGKTRNLRDIGKALGVATILEGTVRKAGNRVRLSVQLIDTTTDAHLWAETFERELTDVFQIQTAVADEIAQALKLSFSAEERGAVDKQASANPEAYDLYLRARRYGDYFYTEGEDLTKARELLERAIALDPGFAEAHGRLAVVAVVLHEDGVERTPERLAQSVRATSRALELDPQLPSAHFAKAYSEYRVHKRFEVALADLDRVLAREPNYAEALTMRGWLYRRLGRWDEMLGAFARAVELNPRHPEVLQSAAGAAVWLRRYAEAAQYYDRAVAAAPDNLDHAAARATHEINWHGDLALLREVVRRAETTELSNRRQWAWDLALREGRIDEAERLVAQWHANQFRGPAGTTLPRSLYQAYHAWLRGDEATARRLAGDSRREFEPQLTGRADPGQFGFLMALITAVQGDAAGAHRWLDTEADYARSIDDEVLIRGARSNRATVLALLGEHDAALALLEELLADPVGGTTADAAELETNPIFRRGLGDDPRFKAIIAKHRPSN